MAKTLNVSEKKFLGMVEQLCGVLGYEYYHTWNSRHSAKGFPDLVMLNVSKARLIVAELKSEKGKLTKFQEKWIEMFRACGVEAYVWYYHDWDKIVEIMQR